MIGLPSFVVGHWLVNNQFGIVHMPMSQLMVIYVIYNHIMNYTAYNFQRFCDWVTRDRLMHVWIGGALCLE